MTIILLVRGLSARWLGCYGNEWVATPNLDRLAAGGVVYDNCYADGVPEFAEATVLKDARDGGPPLAKLRKSGSLSPGFVGERVRVRGMNPDLSQQPSITDEVSKLTTSSEASETESIFLTGEIPPHPSPLPPQSRGERELIVIDSTAFVEPWHAPQELIDDYDDANEMEARYAAAITYFDAEFGALRELAPEATWVVMGTNGFNFNGEDRDHVPLIVHRPGAANKRILELVSTSSVASILTGDVPTSKHVISGKTIRTAEWTLDLSSDSPRLFHRPEDRFQVHNVARLHPDLVEELSMLSPR